MNRVVKGAIIGFFASMLIFAIPLLVDPTIFKEDPPGFNSRNFAFVVIVLGYGVIVGLLVGVPVGAIAGLFFPKTPGPEEMAAQLFGKKFSEEDPAAQPNDHATPVVS